MKLVWSFLVFFVYNWSTIFSTNLGKNELSFYVCDIIKDLFANEAGTQDIVIGNLGGKIWPSTVNDIAECAVKNGNSVILTDFKRPIKEKKLRKAALMILAFEDINQELDKALTAQSTVWNHKLRIICLTIERMNVNSISLLIPVLASHKILNFVALYQTGDKIFTYWLKTVTGKLLRSVFKQKASMLFRDKLKNLDRYRYVVPVCNQIPRVIVTGGTVSAPMELFLNAVAKIQNAEIKYIILENCSKLFDYWQHRLMDLTYNTRYSTSYRGEPKLLTYEETGYCALVPLPGKTPIFQLIFVRPFDGLTWLCIFLTVMSSFVVWWLFRGHGAVDSPSLIVYGLFVMFIGQGVDFSRRNRAVLTILLQLNIFMVFLLNNLYDGAITSFMIQPSYENRLKTFDDLLLSNFDILIEEKFESIIQTSEEYEFLKPRFFVANSTILENVEIEFKRQHFAFIMLCDTARSFAAQSSTLKGGVKVSELYYLMPTFILPHFIELEASHKNPFIERLQYYMDLSFQAGLTQFWQISTKGYESDVANDATYLKLEDLSQVFGILFIGHTLALLALLCEIFFHDFLRNLKFGYLAKKLRNRVYPLAYKKRIKNSRYQRGALFYIIHRHQKKKRLKPKKLNVRKIFVRPRVDLENGEDA